MDGLKEIARREVKADQGASLRIFDCDVHPVPQQGLSSLSPYLPKAWAERFNRKQAMHDGLNVPIRFKHPNGSVVRQDARTPDGGHAASSPEFLIRDLLDTHGIDGALLNCFDAGGLLSVQASTEESIVLATAYNEYFIEEWLSVDRRLKYAPAVPTQDPAASAAEIRRVGKHAQVSAIFVPLVNMLMGHRYYWPIYEACEELSLPVYIHVTGIESIFSGTPTMGMGTFESYIERYAAVPQMGMVSVGSLILSGTLERFPKLKFIFAEYGFLWVSSLLYRMDRTWRGLRHEVPWVRKSPTEYMHERFLFTTQPCDEPDNPRDLETLISLLGHDILCFSSDYPHWDNDMPAATLQMLSPSARKAVFYDNAARALRL
jgi:predicted TIM-barrel fold metal-dependent hydrolase